MKIISVFDQLGRCIEVIEKPKRIISLVPSQTELLYDLGLDEEVVGITKFCIHPEKWHKTKTRIGGTKNPDFEKIRKLNPDFILCNKEENQQEHINQLAAEFPVWISDIKNLNDACAMIKAIGEVTFPIRAQEIIDSINSNFHYLNRHLPKHLPGKSKKILYLIWHNPIMVAGGDTFINAMVQQCGFLNIVESKLRYPVIELNQLKEINADYLFLSSEPFPFKQKHADELQEYCPGSKIVFVNGEFFSWYGSRLMHAPTYFLQLINSLEESDRK